MSPAVPKFSLNSILRFSPAPGSQEGLCELIAKLCIYKIKTQTVYIFIYISLGHNSSWKLFLFHHLVAHQPSLSIKCWVALDKMFWGDQKQLWGWGKNKMFGFYLTPQSSVLAPLPLQCCPFPPVAKSSYNIHKWRLSRAGRLIYCMCSATQLLK